MFLSVCRSWPSLVISQLNGEAVCQLVDSEFAMRCTSLSSELQDQVISCCQRSGCPRYVVVLSAFLARFVQSVPCMCFLSHFSQCSFGELGGLPWMSGFCWWVRWLCLSWVWWVSWMFRIETSSVSLSGLSQSLVSLVGMSCMSLGFLIAFLLFSLLFYHLCCLCCLIVIDFFL